MWCNDFHQLLTGLFSLLHTLQIDGVSAGDVIIKVDHDKDDDDDYDDDDNNNNKDNNNKKR